MWLQSSIIESFCNCCHIQAALKICIEITQRDFETVMQWPALNKCREKYAFIQSCICGSLNYSMDLKPQLIVFD